MTENKEVHAAKGLEDVVVGPSTITFLDGLQGRMIYRGYSAVDLSTQVTFEEVAYLLWEGDLPNRAMLAPFAKAFADARALPPAVLDLMAKFPKTAHPMDVLRTGVSLLALTDPDVAVHTPEACLLYTSDAADE